jgi:hypothetical protein
MPVSKTSDQCRAMVCNITSLRFSHLHFKATRRLYHRQAMFSNLAAPHPNHHMPGNFSSEFQLHRSIPSDDLHFLRLSRLAETVCLHQLVRFATSNILDDNKNRETNAVCMYAAPGGAACVRARAFSRRRQLKIETDAVCSDAVPVGAACLCTRAFSRRLLSNGRRCGDIVNGIVKDCFSNPTEYRPSLKDNSIHY